MLRDKTVLVDSLVRQLGMDRHSRSRIVRELCSTKKDWEHQGNEDVSSFALRPILQFLDTQERLEITQRILDVLTGCSPSPTCVPPR
ncbi:MAG: hypothetical protein Q4B30_06660 [Coriobacteriaceae bacterium]|nr:hypothetical protein [Coriobacteriaceae bacterium]